jgi:hypothetical protein
MPSPLAECLKLNILIMFFLNIIGAYYSGLRNSCSIFRACFSSLSPLSSFFLSSGSLLILLEGFVVGIQIFAWAPK